MATLHRSPRQQRLIVLTTNQVDLGFVQGLEQHPWLWRIPLAMQSCFAIFSATILFMLPDTPRWYYAVGKEAQGDNVLARLHGLPIDHEAVQLVKAEIFASLKEEDNEEKISFWILFWDNTELQFGRRLRTAFWINWVSLHTELDAFDCNVLIPFSHPGSTIPGHQHVGVLQRHNLQQPQLLAVVVGYLGRCFEYRIRPRVISTNLLHRESRSPRDDDLVRPRLRPLHACVHYCHHLTEE